MNYIKEIMSKWHHQPRAHLLRMKRMAKSQARSRKLSYRNSTLEEPLADLDDNQELEAGTRVEPPTRMISHHSSEYFSMSHSSDEYESEYA